MRKSRKRRPQSHILAEEAINKLREIILAEGWIARELTHDYGNDVNIELVENGCVLNKHVYAQVKGQTRAKIRDDFVVFSIKVEDLKYLEQCDIPSFLIIYSKAHNKLFWIWVQKYIDNELTNKNPQWRDQKTITIYLPKNRTISNSIPELREIILKGPKYISQRISMSSLVTSTIIGYDF